MPILYLVDGFFSSSDESIGHLVLIKDARQCAGTINVVLDDEDLRRVAVLKLLMHKVSPVLNFYAKASYIIYLILDFLW